MIVPALSTMATFCIYSLQPSQDSNIIEQAFSQLSLLQAVFIMFPAAISLLTDSLVSLERIEAFLRAPEVNYSPVVDAEVGISLEEVKFSWGSEFSIEVPHLSLPKGSLSILCGRVGSGKSSLLSGIVGDMHLDSGSISIGGAIGYCPQQAWIQNKTIKQNILFGKEFDEVLYQKALFLSALVEDLALFANGDETEIGERGINLSGGQKQRISIARMIYADPAVIVMDDPFSALDYRVGNHIFTKCILEHFAGRTRVIATHRTSFCSHADVLMVMEEGGKLKTSLNDPSVIANIELERESPQEKTKDLPVKKPLLPGIIIKEQAEESNVSLKTYLFYFKPLLLLVLVVLLAAINQVFVFSPLSFTKYCIKEAKKPLFIIAYSLLLAALIMVFSISSSMATVKFSLSASTRIFEQTLKNLIHGLVGWFDSVPTGRLLSRFSNDLDQLDNFLSDAFLGFLLPFISVLMAIAMLMVKDWKLLILLPPFGLVLLWLQSWFRATVRHFLCNFF